MSFKKTGSHYDKNLKEWLEHFEAEYESDVSALPEANPGSTCLVKETGQTVVMANNGVWGGGSGGGASSWNDLKDKPFYADGFVAVDVVPETTLVFADGQGMFETAFSLTIGEKYTVKWNGTEYECDGKAAIGEGGVNVGVCVGNLTGEGDEPFSIIAVDPSMIEAAGTSNLVMAMDGSETATVSVTQTVENIKKLDNKFLDLDWLPIKKKTPNAIFESVIEVKNYSSDPSNHYEVSDSYLINETLPLTVGKEYRVTWDGVDYDCIATALDEDGVDVTGYLGNLHLMSSSRDDTTEPFCIIYGAGTIIYAVWGGSAYNETEQHIVIVSELVETPDKIPAEFLPSGGGGDTIVFRSDGVSTVECDMTGAEIVRAVHANPAIRAVMVTDMDEDNTILIQCSMTQFTSEMAAFLFASPEYRWAVMATENGLEMNAEPVA